MAAKKPPTVDQRAESVTMIPIGSVHPAPDNPRQELGDLSELRDSIKAQGILQPLVVVPQGADGQLMLEGHYMVVIGHRRLAAAAELELAWVPCIVRKYDEQGRVEAMVVENLQRVDLSPLEEAAAFAKLTSPPIGLSQRQVAERVGRSQAHVSKRLALLALPAEARAAVDSGRITHDEAALLTKLADHPERLLDSLKAAQNGLLGRRVGEHLNELLAAEAQKATRALLDAEGITVLGHAKSRWENAWSLQKQHVADCPADGPYTDEILAAKKKLGAYINFDGSVTYVSTEPVKAGKRGEDAREKVWREQQAAKEREREAQRAATAARREALKLVVAGRMAAVHRDFVIRMAPYLDVFNREADELAELLGIELPDAVHDQEELDQLLADWAAAGADRDLRLAYACALIDGEGTLISTFSPAVMRGIHESHLKVLGLLAPVEEGAGEPAPESPDSGDAPASPSVADGIRRAQAELDREGPLRTDPEVGDFGDPVVPLDHDEPQPCPVCVKLVNGKCRACGREVRLDYVDGKPVTKAVARSVA